MDKVQFVSSKLLSDVGLSHGWFMRFGGVSEGVFESLNGKKGNGDAGRNVDENRQRALATLCHTELDSVSSCNKDSFRQLADHRDDSIAHIVHEFKTKILVPDVAGEFKNFDASITDKKDITLSQTTADCASVIIADTEGGCVALVHGSWHTLKAKIICDVVAKLKIEFGVTKLVAGIGPMICENCYEFGPEAKDLFDPKHLTPLCHPRDLADRREVSVSERNAGDPYEQKIEIPDSRKALHGTRQVRNDKREKYLVDLKQMVIDQLQESGVTEIDDLNICTLEDKRFFSHRRSGAHSGRMITLASLK